MVVYEIDGAKKDMIMDMPLVNVRRQNIFILPFGDFIGKLPPDFMRLFRRGFSRLKRLDKVVG